MTEKEKMLAGQVYSAVGGVLCECGAAHLDTGHIRYHGGQYRIHADSLDSFGRLRVLFPGIIFFPTGSPARHICIAPWTLASCTERTTKAGDNLMAFPLSRSISNICCVDAFPEDDILLNQHIITNFDA